MFNFGQKRSMLEPAVIVLIMLNLETLNSSNYKIKNCIIIQSRVGVCV